MAKTAEPLWTRNELAAYLGLTVTTVKTYMSREPDRLPPRAATTEGGVRWKPDVVRAWAARQPAPATTPKGGRPRNEIKPPRKRAASRSKP
ncbi:Uncharacterised protein [Burkholderia pseudomallei]|nr:Uncharacterised protein [Burkholderia pseudomallei]